jgi:hypothetical protein
MKPTFKLSVPLASDFQSAQRFDHLGHCGGVLVATARADQRIEVLRDERRLRQADTQLCRSLGDDAQVL